MGKPLDEYGAPLDWSLERKIRNAEHGIAYLRDKMRECTCGGQCLSCQERRHFVRTYEDALDHYRPRLRAQQLTALEDKVRRGQ